MATQGDGAAPEPNEESQTINATPSSSKCSANKAKRLLPMELRKRRRTAKLQVLAEKKAQVLLEPLQTFAKTASLMQGGEDKTRAESGLNDQEATRNKEEKEESVSAEPSAMTASESSPLTCAGREAPLATVGTATRLHSLYTSTISGQKRQQLRSGTNVPNTFHVTDLPLDVVPKTKLSILTAFPYPFMRINSQIKKQALQNFVAGSTAQSVSHSNAVRWQQALHYFVHPADSLPRSMLVNRATDVSTSELLGGLKGERKREEKAFLTARWNTWQEAFRDVYMSFRRQEGGVNRDSSFYLRSSDCVVYFEYESGIKKETQDISSLIALCQQHDEETEASKNEMEIKNTRKRRLCAVMSQSSERTRKVLHHLNVAYTMPYINANQTQREVGEFHMLAEELEANSSRNADNGGGPTIAHIARAVSTPENMHGADSLLLFNGHDAVHGLYEFLINRAPMSSQDVPELYALHPFANASIQSLQVMPFGRVGGAPTKLLTEDQPSQSTTLFRTEISGFCFPSSIAKLIAILKNEWELVKPSHYSVLLCTHGESTTELQKPQIALRAYMEAMTGAERLNAVKLNEQIAEDVNQEEERQKRQQELEFSKRRLEAVALPKTESYYDVVTTSRPIAARS